MIALIDSWAWIEYFLGTARGRKISTLIDDKKQARITTKINVFEVYYKLLKERGKETAEKFTGFMARSSSVQELDYDIIHLAAEMKLKRGLGMADAIVLATAIKNKATIYTGDKDFAKIKEAEVVLI